MLNRYENFLKILDEKLNRYFDEQCEYIKCKAGCSMCCEVGEYPFSKLEIDYIMSGFAKLHPNLRRTIFNKIKHLKHKNPKMHECPFLIDKKCSVYPYRGIVCRIHGLAWYDEDVERIRLPYCVNKGLNYAKVFNRETGEVFLDEPIKERLRIDSLLTSDEAKQIIGLLDPQYLEIKPLLKWFL